MSSDARNIVVTATTSQSATDKQLVAFVGCVADRVFGDKDAESVVVFLEPSDNDQNVRSVALSRSRWESVKANPLSPSALVPGCEASGDITAPSTGGQSLDKDRTDFAERIDTLKRKGVGVEPYLKALQDWQSDVQQGAQESAREKMVRLTESVETQEKSLASRGSVRLKSTISQTVSLQPSRQNVVATMPVVHAQPKAVRDTDTQPQKLDDAYTIMQKYLGMSSINELHGSEQAVGDQLPLILAAKFLGPDCPDVDGPFLVERVRIALRIQELEHQRVQSSSYREYNQDKIEALVRTRNPRYAHQIADNIQYLERQIGVKELDRIRVR
ncbi:MAG TPA: hypothetical protein V6D22_22970 [Candidatus Obscuribacterales bacterium]